MSTSPRLGITRLIEGQLGGEVTVNDGFNLVDLFTQMTVQSRVVVAQPGSPTDGQAWIIPTGATGAAWSGQDGKIGRWLNSAWVFITPVAGLRAWVVDDANVAVYDGTRWTGAARSVGFYRQVGTSPERWYVPNNKNATALTGGGVSLTANTMFAVPFVCERGGTIDRIGFATGGTASGNVRVGLYEATSRTDIRPGNLIYDSGNIAVTTNTSYKHTIPTPITLIPGELYWLVIEPSATTAVQSVPLAACEPIFGGDGSGNFPTAFGVGFTLANTGALPSTFGTPTVLTTVPPAIWVRYSG
jgi:hypothetical protein